MRKKILIKISCYIFIIINFLPQNIKADDLFNQGKIIFVGDGNCCLLYTSPSPRDGLLSRMPSSA